MILAIIATIILVLSLIRTNLPCLGVQRYHVESHVTVSVSFASHICVWFTGLSLYFFTEYCFNVP